jgi:chitodextrinase
LRYAWSASGFTPASATTVSPSFTAPATAGPRTISLTVTDSQNRPASTTHTVAVSPPVPDTEAPSTPGNFRVTATTDTTVSLAWEAATDNVGVTHYQVRNEGGWLVKTVTGLTHTEEGLQPGTEYKYTVSARDKELNTSVYSPMISATTATTPVVPAPVAEITGPTTVEAGQPLALSASSSTGSGLRYAWTATGFSPASATTVSPSFTAPATAGPREISLTVTDSQSRPATARHPVTVTAPPIGGGCDYRDPAAGSVPAWTAQNYSGGARVSYQNVIWQASYATGSTPPDRNDAWKLVSAIPVQRAYEGGNQVHHQDSVYRAGWWIKGTAPPASPWTRIGPCQ